MLRLYIGPQTILGTDNGFLSQIQLRGQCIDLPTKMICFFLLLPHSAE